VRIMNLSDLGLVDAELVAAAVLDDIGAAQRAWQRQNVRPRVLSAREALIALEFETLLVGVAASNLANGVELSDRDRERLMLACERITAIADEAVG
jgi:hypothetical protein